MTGGSIGLPWRALRRAPGGGAYKACGEETRAVLTHRARPCLLIGDCAAPLSVCEMVSTFFLLSPH